MRANRRMRHGAWLLLAALLAACTPQANMMAAATSQPQSAKPTQTVPAADSPTPVQITVLADPTPAETNLAEPPAAAPEVPEAVPVPASIATLGETVDAVRDRYLARGGQEIDLAARDLDNDGWLFAFADDEGTLLIHTADDYDDDGYTIGAYALYDREGALIGWEGSAPVALEQAEAYLQDADHAPFPQYIGYWGENYDESVYVYFLDRCGFFLYDQWDNSGQIALIP